MQKFCVRKQIKITIIIIWTFVVGLDKTEKTERGNWNYTMPLHNRLSRVENVSNIKRDKLLIFDLSVINFWTEEIILSEQRLNCVKRVKCRCIRSTIWRVIIDNLLGKILCWRTRRFTSLYLYFWFMDYYRLFMGIMK